VLAGGNAQFGAATLALVSARHFSVLRKIIEETEGMARSATEGKAVGSRLLRREGKDIVVLMECQRGEALTGWTYLDSSSLESFAAEGATRYPQRTEPEGSCRLVSVSKESPVRETLEGEGG
jgi:hypothetical protein